MKNFGNFQFELPKAFIQKAIRQANQEAMEFLKEVSAYLLERFKSLRGLSLVFFSCGSFLLSNIDIRNKNKDDEIGKA